MKTVVDFPIFPLQTVLFPDGRLDLRIFEARYVDMVRKCLRESSDFGVCLILDGRETGQAAVPHRIGCSARIEQCDVPSPGLFRLVCRGQQPFQIIDSAIAEDGLRTASVHWLDQAADIELPTDFQSMKSVWNSILDQLGDTPFLKPYRPDQTAWCAHRLAEATFQSTAAKQRLLEANTPMEKLQLVTNYLNQHYTSE